MFMVSGGGVVMFSILHRGSSSPNCFPNQVMGRGTLGRCTYGVSALLLVGTDNETDGKPQMLEPLEHTSEEMSGTESCWG